MNVQIAYAGLFMVQWLYDEISNIAHLNFTRKVKQFFWRAHLPYTIFSTRIDSQNYLQLVKTPQS